MFDFPERGIERYIGKDDDFYYTEEIATGAKKQYHVNPPSKAEKLKILCLGAYVREDEEFTYTIDIFNDGNCNTNKRPKHPEMPREECLKRAGQALLRAWFASQNRVRVTPEE